MSRKTSAAALTLLFAIIFMLPVSAHASDISIGATAWYAEWDPVFTKYLSKPPLWSAQTVVFNSENKTERTLLAGPVISFSFLSRFNLSTVFVMGEFDGTASCSYNTPPSSVIHTLPSSYKSRKADLDSTLNYSLFSSLKIFAGIKYQGYDTTITSLDPVSKSELELDADSNAMGAGAGASFTYPLIENLFFLFNASGVYLRTINEFSYSFRGYDFLDNSFKDTYNSYGGNTAASLAYYFPSTGITLSAGVRYQHLKYFIASGDDRYELDGQSDKFYGLTMSAIYTF